MSTNDSSGVDRRDFLKMSTMLPTSAAIGALAVAGNQAVAYTTTSADQTSGLHSSMSEEEIAALPRVKQELVPPPFAPEHEQVASGGPKVIEVTMVTHEKRWKVDDSGAEVWALTFDGSVPRTANCLSRGRLC